ncbi:hypothetical protein V6N11_004011 [Hibiscus sabdariffa]|uniref:Uncharacterized protein n=1 Tax=Hibiscus sabdariffa TaxID=183260 RepID=A0ABR2SFN9_9ROSI
MFFDVLSPISKSVLPNSNPKTSEFDHELDYAQFITLLKGHITELSSDLNCCLIEGSGVRCDHSSAQLSLSRSAQPHEPVITRAALIRLVNPYGPEAESMGLHIKSDRSCTEAVPDQRLRTCQGNIIVTCRDSCRGRRENTKRVEFTKRMNAVHVQDQKHELTPPRDRQQLLGLRDKPVTQHAALPNSGVLLRYLPRQDPLSLSRQLLCHPAKTTPLSSCQDRSSKA